MFVFWEKLIFHTFSVSYFEIYWPLERNKDYHNLIAGLFRPGLNWKSAKAKFARRIVKITFFSKISDYIQQLCYTELWTCYSKELETLKFATKASSDLHAGSVMPLWREFLRPEAYRPLGKNLLIRELLLSVNAGHCWLNFGQNMQEWLA